MTSAKQKVKKTPAKIKDGTPLKIINDVLPVTSEINYDSAGIRTVVPPRQLQIYRVRVKISTPEISVVDYFVEAPTQCSATKYTALRDEVEDIMVVELWHKPLSVPLTFSTDKDCP